MANANVPTKVEIRYVPDEQVGDVYRKVLVGDDTGYLSIDKLEVIDLPGLEHSRREANHPKNLETIYKHYQAIDGDDAERTQQLKVRSMSLGDAIVIAGKGYYVTSEGFVTRNDAGEIVVVDATD